MQPRPEPFDPVRALAWRIACDNELLVTIVVADHHVLLHSNDGRNPEAESKFRLGTYMDANEAALKAIDMTGSYERLRHGRVGEYAELTLPAADWLQTLADGNVELAVTKAIETALSPTVSPAAE